MEFLKYGFNPMNFMQNTYSMEPLNQFSSLDIFPGQHVCEIQLARRGAFQALRGPCCTSWSK